MGALVCSLHCPYIVHRARLPPAVYMVAQLEFLPAGPRPVAIFKSALVTVCWAGRLLSWPDLVASAQTWDRHFI